MYDKKYHVYKLLISCYFRIVKGLHVNFAPPVKPRLTIILSMLLGRYFPRLFGFTHHDVKRIFPFKQKLVVNAVKETGYMHIQATKPDTAGKGNPSVIVEKSSNTRQLNYFCCKFFENVHFKSLP